MKPGSKIPAAQTAADATLAIWKLSHGIALRPAMSGTTARKGPKKRPDEDGEHSPLLEESHTARNEIGIAGERPRPQHAVLEVKGQPVGQPIADNGAERRSEPHRPEAELGGCDQTADAKKDARRRNQQGHEGEGFAKGQNENDRNAPGLMVVHEGDRRSHEIVHFDASFGHGRTPARGGSDHLGTDIAQKRAEKKNADRAKEQLSKLRARGFRSTKIPAFQT